MTSSRMILSKIGKGRLRFVGLELYFIFFLDFHKIHYASWEAIVK